MSKDKDGDGTVSSSKSLAMAFAGYHAEREDNEKEPLPPEYDYQRLAAGPSSESSWRHSSIIDKTVPQLLPPLPPELGDRSLSAEPSSRSSSITDGEVPKFRHKRNETIELSNTTAIAMDAVMGGDKSALKLINSIPFDWDVVDKDENNILMVSVNAGYVEFIAKLLTHLAQQAKPDPSKTKPSDIINHVNGVGDSALHLALRLPNNHPEKRKIITCLLRYGANINAVNKAHTTPLDIAVSQGDLELVDYLMQKGAHPTAGMLNPTNLIWQRFIINPKQQKLGQVLYTKIIDYIQKNNLHNGNEQEFFNHALHCAALLNDLENVELFIKCKANVNTTGVDKRTPIYYAVLHKNYTMLETLLKQPGTNPNIQDTRGGGVLHLAASQRLTGFVEILLEYGAEPALQDSLGNTVLHAAAKNGDVKIVGLIQHKVDLRYIANNQQQLPGELVDQTKNPKLKAALLGEDFTHLHRALACGTVKDVQHLMQKDHKLLYMVDYNGDTILHIAIKTGNPQMVYLIINIILNNSHLLSYIQVALNRQGVSALELRTHNQEIHEMLCQIIYFIDPKTTSLHRAVFNNQLERVKEIIAQHPEYLKAQDCNGDTPLHVAAWYNRYSKIINLLLGADFSIVQDKRSNKRGELVEDLIPQYVAKFKKRMDDLYEAISNKNINKIRRLISDSPELLYTQDPDGNTPVHLALSRDVADEIVESIIFECPYGVLLKKNRHGNTPLHVALYFKRSSSIVSKIIYNDLSLIKNMMEIENVKREKAIDRLQNLDPELHSVVLYHIHEKTKLAHIAMVYGDSDGVQDWFTNGLITAQDCVSQDKHGDTPLHLAVQYQSSDIIAQLLRKNPQAAYIKNHQGKTPRDLIPNPRSNDEKAICKMLDKVPRAQDGRLKVQPLIWDIGEEQSSIPQPSPSTLLTISEEGEQSPTSEVRRASHNKTSPSFVSVC
jgi:ankyrin repeat protein